MPVVSGITKTKLHANEGFFYPCQAGRLGIQQTINFLAWEVGSVETITLPCVGIHLQRMPPIAYLVQLPRPSKNRSIS